MKLEVWCSLAFAALGISACAPHLEPRRTEKQGAAPSNVLREDYAGCHSSIFEKWRSSPMRRMTRRASGAQARAPFDGSRFQFKEDLATMSSGADGGKYIHVSSAKYGSAWYRVTKVIGGRYREDYAGVLVSGPDATAAPGSDERVLPVSYLLFSGEWRYKGYSVMSPERPGLRRGLTWRKSCIFCHNTAPGLSTLFDELYGVGAVTYQGAASVELPSDRRLEFNVTDEDLLTEALSREVELLAGQKARADDLRPLLEEVSNVTLAHFGEEHLVELGIGCESCHGGSRWHAENPNRFRPQLTPQASFLTVSTHQGQPLTEAQSINYTCAKCHTVLFSRYPFTWEGGERGFSPGGSSMNSGEARNFLLGGCASAMSCTTCHDPHSRDRPEALARFDTHDGNAVCTSCHKTLSADPALERHSRHRADGDGSVCTNCHMPKKNVGLDYDLTRYHRIGSPTDHERVEKDRPLECSLCHVDKSVGELVGTMERWWHKRYDRSELARLYGSLEVSPLVATLDRGNAHEQLVAIFVLGKHERQDALGKLVDQLAHEYPLVRFFARDAVERVTGMDLALDMHRPGNELSASVAEQLRAKDGAE